MKVFRILTLLGGVAAAGAAAPAALSAAVPVATPVAVDGRRQDPADSLYRAAREVMGRGDYKRAAGMFRQVFEKYPKSAYAGDARYYEAFTLYRAGNTDDLRRAREVLAVLSVDTVNVPRNLRRDALSLDTRVCGELARRGDEKCARRLRELADSSGFGASVRAVVDGAMGAAVEAMSSVEVQRALGEAQVAAADAAREGVRGAQEAMRSPEVQRALAEAGQVAARASADAARAGADAINGVVWSGSGSSGWSSSGRRRNPNCRDADDDERVIALNALQQMDADRALPLLRKVLARRDECSEILRRKAVFIVAQKKSPEVADLLINTARNDPDPDVRAEAVQWMARVGGERSVDFLRDVALRDTSVALRKRAVFALAQSKETRAKETLRTIATNRDTPTEVRGEAIYWAAARGDSTDAAWVRSIFPSLESRELKERAVSALARQRGSSQWLMEIARDTREPIEVRKSAFAQASRSASVQQLIALWDATKEKELRESIILSLSRRKEPEALDKLIAIARSDPDREMRKSAVFWLSRSSEPRALAFLQELIEK